jgi:hypothetical protein
MKVHVLFEKDDASSIDEVKFSQRIDSPELAGDAVDTLLNTIEYCKGMVLANSLLTAIEGDSVHLLMFVREFDVPTLLELQECVSQVMSEKQNVVE